MILEAIYPPRHRNQSHFIAIKYFDEKAKTKWGVDAPLVRNLYAA